VKFTHISILILILISALAPLALMPVVNAKPIIQIIHYDTVWNFYSDKVTIYDIQNDEYVIVEFDLNGKITASSVAVDGNKVIMTLTSNRGTVVNVFTFASTPTVKLATVVQPNGRNLRFSYVVTIVSGSEDGATRFRGRRLFFDWDDMVRSGLAPAKARSGGTVSVSVNVDNYLVIDPVLGYSEGTTSTTAYYIYNNQAYVLTLSGYYWAYSDANVTYRFDFPALTVDAVPYVIIPKGFDIINITRSDGVNVSYVVSGYNATHNVVVFTANAGYSYTIWCQAWNPIQDIYLDNNYEYIPHGYSTYVNIVVRDPYGNPIDQPVTYWIAASQHPYETVIVQNVSLQPGDALAPHLYTWFFDGVDDYVVVPLTVYGWQGITVMELQYPYWPKANTAYSKYTMLGDYWTDYPSFFWATDNRYNYTWLNLHFVTRSPDGTRRIYTFSIYDYRNTWVSTAWSFDLSTRALVGYVNGVRVYSATVPSNETTVLEWNPDTATNPQWYRRLVLGTSVGGAENMKMMQAYVLVYSRALSQDEVVGTQMNRVVNTSGLAVFLDPTFFNGTHYIDLSGNGNHGAPYGGVRRVPDSNTWIYVIKGLYSDGYVHLRFFPIGSVVQFIDSNGNVVRTVVVGSNHEVVPLPPGGYTVKAFISYGTYTSGSAYPDTNGIVRIPITAPSYDAYLYVQANTSGLYAGVKHRVFKVSDIAYSVSVPDFVNKSVPFNVTVSAWMTLDTAPASSITINGTTYSGGVVTLQHAFNESGHHNFTLSISALRDGVYGSWEFSKTVFVAGSINWMASRSYDLKNRTTTITLDAFYDTGEHVEREVYIYLLRGNESELLYAGRLPAEVVVPLSNETSTVVAELADLDGSTYRYFIDTALLVTAVQYVTRTLIVTSTYTWIPPTAPIQTLTSSLVPILGVVAVFAVFGAVLRMVRRL